VGSVLTKIANVISAVFYPLFIPTYGMILFCAAIHQLMPLPWTYWLIVIGSTLLLTFLIPFSLILYQVHKGDIDDIYIKNKDQRTLAYVETICGFGCWWYLLQMALHAPSWLCGVALGGTIAIALVAIINRWWKISAHLTGMGGLVGGILTAFYNLQPTTYYLFYIALAITLLVMYARLYLNAHTQWQVIAGFALGLSCTMLISWIYV